MGSVQPCLLGNCLNPSAWRDVSATTYSRDATGKSDCIKQAPDRHAGPATVEPRCLWECYGPPAGGALLSDAQVVVHGLEAQSHLNETVATVSGWDGQTSCFIVTSVETGQSIKIKAVNLRARGSGSLFWREDYENQGATLILPMEMLLHIANFLTAQGTATFSATACAARSGLWLQLGAEKLWETQLARHFGDSAIDVCRKVRPAAVGPSLYRGARGLLHMFRLHIELHQGSVHMVSGGAEVVACPVLQNLQNAGIGAQGAVRAAAGHELELAISELATPLPELSSTLVPGGALAKRVAVTVTEPPLWLWESMHGGGPREYIENMLAFLEKVHENLLGTVREAGFRFLAMPTLCTGGMGMPVHLVALAALRVLHRDFCEHPEDPIRVRIACYETEHLTAFNIIKDEWLQHFYSPHLVRSVIMSSLHSTAHEV